MTTSLSLADTADLAARLVAEIGRAVVGKHDAVERVLLGLLADGHVLLDDLPGVAKTLTARALATVAGLEFRRIQFTPDLTPSDVTGAGVLDRRTGDIVFRPGPVFANIVLADEVNRAPAKTQSALLEAMQEHQVTADGTSHALPRPFIVLATQNPIEFEGTYPLPEAQLDRFLLRTSIGYPTADDEVELLRRRVARGTDDVALTPIADAATVLAMQAAVEQVHIDEAVMRYIVAIVHATRQSSDVAVGASPRGSLALVKLARAAALLRGRDFTTPDDVKAVLGPALAHRLVLRNELWVRRVAPETVLTRIVDGVPAPVER